MESKEEKYTLTLEEVEIVNSVFPDDEPLFVIDDEHHTFNWAENHDDSVMRLKAKAIELGY